MTAAGAVTVRVSVSTRWVAGPELSCRVCHRPTNMRDSKGAAAHGTCVEQQIEVRVTEFALSLIEAEQVGAAVAA